MGIKGEITQDKYKSVVTQPRYKSGISYVWNINTIIEEVALEIGSGADLAAKLVDCFPALYSMEKTNRYAGNCLRLRRSSDDAESDFVFVNGEVDNTGIISWLAGADGYCKTWYDQSGNGNNAGQNDSSKQPQYDTSGKRLSFDGNNDYMTNTMGTFAQPNTFIMNGLFRFIDATYVFDSNDGLKRSVLCSFGTTWRMFAGREMNWSNVSNHNDAYCVFDRGSSFLGMDGTKTTGDAGSYSINNLNICCRYNQTGFGQHNYKSFVFSQYGLTQTQSENILDFLNA